MKKLLYIFIFLSGSLLFSCKASQKVQKSDINNKGEEQESASFSKLKYDYTFFNATKEKLLGNMSVAVVLYQKCIDMDKTIADPYYELATIYDYNEQYKDALPFAEKAVKYDSDNKWYRQVYAKSLTKNLKYKDAIKQLQILIKKHPNNPDYYYMIAKNYTITKKYKEAINSFNQAEKIIGIQDEISIRKEELYLKLGETDNAISELKALIKANPKDARYSGRLGELYMNNGMEDKAYKIYQDILKKYPDSPYIHLSLAQYYHKKEEGEKAFEETKKAFSNTNLDIDTKVKFLLGYYRLSAKDDSIKENAFELAKILVKTDSTSAQSHTVYGDFLYQDGQIEESRVQYRKALAITKSKFPIWQQILYIDAQLNDYESLQKESNEALNYFPNQAIVYFLNGVANSQLKEYKNAINSFKMADDLATGNEQLKQQIISAMADTYYQQGNIDTAFSLFDQSLKTNPKDAGILNNYAYYLSENNQNLKKAESMSAAAIKIRPNEGIFQDTYAWIKFKQGDYKEAEKWIDKALSNGGDKSGVTLEHKGDILYKLGKTEQALSYWKKAKEQGETSDFIDKKIKEKKFYEK